MSRIGRLPIELPKGVEVNIQGAKVTVKGPKGELTREFRPEVLVAIDDGHLVVTRTSEVGPVRALHGLTRALLANMVHGVAEGFRKSLEIEGLGYRASVQGSELSLQVGHSHPVKYLAPNGITFEVEKGDRIIHVNGIDNEVVGQTAAEIRGIRPPEPYKGKGIRYLGEKIRRKAGKAGKAAA